MKKILLVFLCIFLCISCAVKRIGNVRVVNVTDKYVNGSIDLTKATVVYDKNDWKVVNNSVRLFVSDVMKVTGDTLTAQEPLPSGGDIVLIGSIGKSKWIDKLIEEKKLKIAVLTVPGAAAQGITDTLVACGIKAIWNFAPVKLAVAKGVVVQQEDIASGLAELCARLKAR